MTGTIEVSFPEAKSGIIVQVEGAQAFDLEQIIRGAAQIGAGFEAEIRRVNDPGWWAALVCASALHHRFAACVQRVRRRGDPHGEVEVVRGALVDLYPTWPTFRVGGPRLVDIRPESILEAGPSDSDLKRYALAIGLKDVEPADLRRSFDLGVLEWDVEVYSDGRWKLRAAI